MQTSPAPSTPADLPESGPQRGEVAAVLRRLERVLPTSALLTDPAQLSTYECDGLAYYRVTPALVVLARDAADIRAAVAACAAEQVPFVARGSGTGLSGGALPHAEGVLIVMSQMREIRGLAPQDQRDVVGWAEGRRGGWGVCGCENDWVR